MKTKIKPGTVVRSGKLCYTGKEVFANRCRTEVRPLFRLTAGNI